MKQKAPELPIRVEFRVHGEPQPQGSTRAFVPKGWTRPIITSANKKLKPWRQDVSDVALAAMRQAGQVMTLGPVSVRVHFYFDRPKSVKAKHKTSRPDADKILRGCFDSMSGIVFKDDAQVVHVEMWKSFGTPGANITVESVL